MRHSAGLTKSALVTGTVMTYVLIYPPFVFQGMLDHKLPGLRIVWEVVALALLALIAWKKSLRSTQVLLSVAMLLFTAHFAAVAPSESRTVYSTLTKILFGMLVTNGLCLNETLRRRVTKLWVCVGWYLAASAPVFMVFYIVGLPFIEITRPESLGLGRYTYHLNPLIGSHLVKNMYYLTDMPIPRFTSWVIEPGQLSFLYAFNIAGAKSLIAHNRRRRLFQWVNIFAGLSTLSFTFLVFIAVATVLTAAYRSFVALRVRYREQSFSVTIMAVGVLAALIAAVLPLVGTYTSFADRIQRIRSAGDIVRTSSHRQLLFGHGLDVYHGQITSGFSNGFLRLLVERGLLVTALVFGMIWIYTRKSPLVLMTTAVFFLAFDLFPWPIFWLALAICCAQVQFARTPQRSSVMPSQRDRPLGHAVQGSNLKSESLACL